MVYNCCFTLKGGKLAPECRSFVLLLILLLNNTLYNYIIGCLIRSKVYRNYSDSRCSNCRRAGRWAENKRYWGGGGGGGCRHSIHIGFGARVISHVVGTGITFLVRMKAFWNVTPPVQTGSGAHPASYKMANRSLSGVKAAGARP
jgi:hypothetical protein